MMWWNMLRLNMGGRNAQLRAVGKLAADASPRALHALAGALKASDSGVRTAAEEALAGIGPPAVDELVRMLDDPQAWKQALGLLGRIGDPRAVEPLCSDLVCRVLRREAGEIAKVLLGFGDYAVERLSLRLRDDSSEVRVRLTKALTECGDRRFAPALTPLLRDPDSQVRAHAAQALKKMKWKPADDTDKAFWAVAAGEWQCVAALGPAALPALIAAVEDRFAEEKTRSTAAGLLARLGDSSPVPALIAELEDRGSETRSTAAELLARLGDRRALPALLTVLAAARRTAPRIALSAEAVGAHALATGNRELAEMALAGFQYEELERTAWTPFRRALVRAVGRIADPSAVPALTDCLDDIDAGVRGAAADALARIQGAPARQEEPSSRPGAAAASVVAFRDGEPPADPEQYVHSLFAQQPWCQGAALRSYRLVGVAAPVDLADAADLFRDLTAQGKLPSFGHAAGAFQGAGPDDRPVTAFFFQPSPGRPPLLPDQPACGACGGLLTGGESVTGGQDYRLFLGSVCIRCLLAFCADCLGGAPERCPRCRGETKPAYYRHLTALAALLG